MRFLPRFPLYAAVALTCTVLLTTSPASAEFDITEAPPDEQFPCTPPTDDAPDLTSKTWTIDFIGIEEAHQYNRGSCEDGEPVKIAVIDSGVQATLPIFEDRVLEGFDPWDPSALGQCDGYYHGTAVAAIAAGGAEGRQFIGVAPEAEVIPIRAFLADEGGDTARSNGVAESITAAVANDADVINISINLVHTDALRTAVVDAIEAGVVIVAATGNDGRHMDDAEKYKPQEQTFYPANYPEVIAVGAHNPSGSWYAQTNFGDNLDLLAPGELVTFPYVSGEGFIEDSGTSYSAPHVAGAAALLKGYFGRETSPEWIQQRLKETAIPPPNEFNKYQGHGVVNLPNALTAPDHDDQPTDAASETVAEEDRPGIDAIRVDYDPLATEKTIAWASIGGAILLIILVLVLRKVVPQGRGRGWRPGTRRRDNLPARPGDDGL